MRISHKITGLLALVVITAAIPSIASAQGAAKPDGLYCHTVRAIDSLPPNNDGSCPAGSTKLGGVNVCQAVTNLSQQKMFLRLNEDTTLDVVGGTLKLDSQSVCSFSGKAAKTTKGWRMQFGMDNENPRFHCIIDIEIDNIGNVNFTTPDVTAPCSAYCGANNIIHGTSFPAESRRNSDQVNKIIDDEGDLFYAVDHCAS